MIESFADKRTAAVFDGQHVKGLPSELQDAMRRKLKVIDASGVLDSLRVPPGNALEALKGDRKGQHSIRVNQRWRICFRWRAGNAHEVEIVDYH